MLRLWRSWIDSLKARTPKRLEDLHLNDWQVNVRDFNLANGMKMRTKSLSALLLATIAMATAAVVPATSYNDTVKANFSHPISNVPGKSLVAVEVSYPPGGASAPHRHSAFVYAYTSSRVRSRAR